MKRGAFAVWAVYTAFCAVVAACTGNYPLAGGYAFGAGLCVFGALR